MNKQQFIKKVQQVAESNNIRLFLPKDVKRLEYEDSDGNVSYSSGYFSAEQGNKELACAMGSPMALAILAHESSHMDQHLEQSSYWTALRIKDRVKDKGDACTALFTWIDGDIELNNKELEIVVEAARNLELDCERRTVQKIRKYGLPINIPEYIQKSNCYVYFYTYMKETRRWYPKNKAPYEDKKIWSQFPATFHAFDEKYNTLPNNLREAFDSLFTS